MNKNPIYLSLKTLLTMLMNSNIIEDYMITEPEDNKIDIAIRPTNKPEFIYIPITI